MATVTDTSIKMDIQASSALILLQDVSYNPRPIKAQPLRHFRAVMGDYRIVNGIPVSPPICDARVPVNVTLNRKGATSSVVKRKLPQDIDTQALHRWLAGQDHISFSDDRVTMFWNDITGQVPWTAFYDGHPLLHLNYDYRIPAHAGRAMEVLRRDALVFEGAMGTCMNIDLAMEHLREMEFILVVWNHPFANRQNAANLLDVGDPLRRAVQMPHSFTESLTGARVRLLRRSPTNLISQMSTRVSDLANRTALETRYGRDLVESVFGKQLPGGGMDLRKLLLNPRDRTDLAVLLRQCFPLLTMHAAPSLSNGRPEIIRMRYGPRPMVERWGPKNTHHRQQASTVGKELVNLATNFVLGRRHGLLSEVSNAGMHLFELNFYDRLLSTTEAHDIVHRLSSAYAVLA